MFRIRGGFRALGAVVGGFLALVALIASCGPAFAHTGSLLVGGFTSGFTHPIRGPDHLLAMFAVGLWGAQMGGRAIWSLPVVFPLIMSVGGFLGVVGVPLSNTEIMVALSVLVLGAAIALEWRAPPSLAIIIVGAFAIFHGFAHGRELPDAADPLAYGIGFVSATGFIHIAGIGFGLLAGPLLAGWGARLAGGLVSLAGLYFLALAI